MTDSSNASVRRASGFGRRTATRGRRGGEDFLLAIRLRVSIPYERVVTTAR